MSNSDCSLNVCVTEAARAFEMAIDIYTDMVGETVINFCYHVELFN